MEMAVVASAGTCRSGHGARAAGLVAAKYLREMRGCRVTIFESGDTIGGTFVNKVRRRRRRRRRR